MPEREHDGRPVLYQGSFYGKGASKEIKVGFASPFFHITVLGIDIDNGGEPASIPGGEIIFEQLDGLHGGPVDDGKGAQHVRGIEDRIAIQQEEVPILLTATYQESVGGVRHVHHAGKNEERAQCVIFSEKLL